MRGFFAYSPWQIAKFSLVGVSNTAVDAGVFTLLVLLFGWDSGGSAVLASTLGFAAGGVNSYIWNSRLTFRTGYQNRERSAVLRFSVVLLTGVALAAAASAVVLALPLPWAGPQRLVVAKLAALGLGAAWNFSLQHHWVFSESGSAH